MHTAFFLGKGQYTNTKDVTKYIRYLQWYNIKSNLDIADTISQLTKTGKKENMNDTL